MSCLKFGISYSKPYCLWYCFPLNPAALSESMLPVLENVDEASALFCGKLSSFIISLSPQPICLVVFNIKSKVILSNHAVQSAFSHEKIMHTWICFHTHVVHSETFREMKR